MISKRLTVFSRQIVASFLALSICAAGLATAIASPAAAATAHAAVMQPSEWPFDESEWNIDDAPSLHGRSWWGGKLTNARNQYGQPYGHGPARHNGSSYAYVSEETGDPTGHWARWDMGNREGTQELAVFVPRADASARVRYRVTIGSRVTYTDWIIQREIYGWHPLGRVDANGNRVRIEVHYNDSQTAPGRSGPAARRVGVDAMAMRCVSNCSTSPPSTTSIPPSGEDEDDNEVPGVPRNVRLQVVDESDGSRTVVATWSPPADGGGSAITNYRVTISRPGRDWTFSRASNDRTLRFRRVRSNTTYTIQVRAQNATGIGATASRSITTPPPPGGDPPSAPRNVRVRVVDESNGTRTVVATWSPPSDDGGSAITNYRVTVSRSGRDWTFSRASNDRTLRFRRVRSNTTYTIQVRAQNATGTGPSVTRKITTPLGRTVVAIKNESRSWLIDDPDAIVEWEAVQGAQSYQLDWRYMEIDVDRLREIYQLLSSDANLTEQRERELSDEAVAILEGTEISADRIGGDSAPHVDPRVPEGFFNLRSNPPWYTINTRNGTWGGEWNSSNLSHIIHSRNDNYVLQARVRAVGSQSSIGPWSDWAFHPSARFAAGCRALEFYNNIKDILKAIDIAGWIVTLAGIIAAAPTGGASAAGSKFAIETLKFIAKEVVKKIVKEVTLKNALKNLIKTALRQTIRSTAKRLLGFVFGCATHTLEMSDDESRELGWRIVDTAWDEIREADWTKSAIEELFDLPGS